MKNKNKIVYIGLSADILHHGHINLINKAKKYGKLIVGLLSDKAVTEKKRMSMLSWSERSQIVKSISGIHKIIKQEEWDYTTNIKKLKPDYFVHGDDWKDPKSYDFSLRKKIKKFLKKTKCKLIEVPHTKNVSSSILINKMQSNNNDPKSRTNILKKLIEIKNFVRIIETHSPLSALIAETVHLREKDGNLVEFDGFWSSSLTDSTLKGKPDIEVLDLNARLNNINEILDVTTKPLIMDGDTGGKREHFQINIRSIERMGVSAVIIEDKKGLKKNSLLKD